MQSEGPIALVLLAGQSNMAGRGPIEGARPADPAAPAGLPVMSWASTGRWVPAEHPLHYDNLDKVGVGPGLAFGRAVAAAPLLLAGGSSGGAAQDLPSPSAVGLVPTAAGGSSLDAWRGASVEGSSGVGADGWLAKALSRADEALAASPPGSRVACILWHQGESDSGSEDLVTSYAARFEGLAKELRRVFGPVPLLIGGLAPWLADCPKTPLWRQTDAVLQGLAASGSEADPRAYVDVSGLDHRGDSLHFDGPSAEMLGDRYAGALHGLSAPRELS